MTHEVSLLLPAVGSIPLAAAWLRWRFRRPRDGLRIRDKVPRFHALPASDARTYSLQDLSGSSALVFIFTANRCPGAKAYEERLNALHDELAPAGVPVLGVDSVSADLYPSETLAELQRARAARGIRYPVLRDEDQRLAHAFGAVCTPHAFLFDAQMRLRYRGRIDDSFLPHRVTRHDLREAIRAVLHGREPAVPETAPLGCAIDWVRPKPNPAVPWWRRAHELSRMPHDPSYRG